VTKSCDSPIEKMSIQIINTCKYIQTPVHTKHYLHKVHTTLTSQPEHTRKINPRKKLNNDKRQETNAQHCTAYYSSM